MILCSGRNTKQETESPFGPEPLMILEDHDEDVEEDEDEAVTLVVLVVARVWKMVTDVAPQSSSHIRVSVNKIE